MPYAFLNPDGTIKMVVPKPTPFMRVGEGGTIFAVMWMVK